MITEPKGSAMAAEGKEYSFEVNAHSSAEPSRLFQLAADGSTWSAWLRPMVLRSAMERKGDPSPGGIGAIRRVGQWPVIFREQTIEYEQDRRHVYTLLNRVPLKNYRGEASFTPSERGTDIRWRVSFTEAVPGTGPVLCGTLKPLISFIVKRLVRAAEQP